MQRFSNLVRAQRAWRICSQKPVLKVLARSSSASHGPLLTNPTDEERMIRDAVRSFANDIVQPKVKEMDEHAKLDAEVLEHLFANGLMGIEVEEEYGGSGLGFTSAIIVIEELAKVDPAVSVIADVHNTLLLNMLRMWGSKELKQKYLPRLATECVGAFCLSEPASGSDAFSLKTRADKDGDDYILNGNKLWITNANEAGLFFVMANVDFSQKHRGITCFLVERDTPGLTIGKKEDKLGIRASSTCPVSFENVRVPASNILGEVGKGYQYAINILNEGRIGIGAQMVGLAQGALEQTLPYLYQRKQFGTYIGDFQAMQMTVGELTTEIEAARLLVYNAARMKEHNQDFVKEAAMAKLYSSQVAEKTASKCIELMGGIGFSKEYPQEKFFRDCKIGAIYEGTSNIQLQTIAKLQLAPYKE